MLVRLLVFLLLNFGALAIGGLFTGKGVMSEWYTNLDQAPWTPPGWFFGVAWTTIMICFSIYMAYLWPLSGSKNVLIGMYALQLILNIGWNPTFFYYHNVSAGLAVISALTILIGLMLFYYLPVLRMKSLLIAPYFLWLLVATSLNGYILLKN